jgi:flagellar biosynthesis protein FlhA
VSVGKLLAINGSDVPAPHRRRTNERAGIWPRRHLDRFLQGAELARGLGYTVVDAPTAIATHINAVIRDNASELLGQDETQQLLDKVAIRYPKLVSNLVPDLLPLSTVTQVLQNLLTEGVPVKDMRNIIDALTAHAKENQDPSHFTTLVRPKLGRLIVQPLVDDSGSLTVITLAPDLEKLLESSRGASDGEHITLDPTLANSMIESLKNEAEKIQDTGQVATLVVSPTLRSWMSRFVRVRVPDLSVLSYTQKFQTTKESMCNPVLAAKPP